jgi:hypothetical protein
MPGKSSLVPEDFADASPAESRGSALVAATIVAAAMAGDATTKHCPWPSSQTT